MTAAFRELRVLALPAAASSAATRPVEMAQVTTLPVLVIPFVLSGLLIPVAMVPGARAHRLDRGGRVGGATLVPLGTAALGRRDTLEG